MIGPKPPDWFRGDGCTMVPDGWWGEACRWHDWAYRFTRTPRLVADAMFCVNLLLCRAPVQLAVRYFVGVVCFGWLFRRKT